MTKYTQKQLRDLIAHGAAVELTAENIPARFDRLGYSDGTCGANGSLIMDRETGRLYATVGRSSLLFRVL